MAVPCHESDLPDVKIVKIGHELSQRTEDLLITRNEILVNILIVLLVSFAEILQIKST